MAKVKLNYKKAGVAWIRPYQLNITEIAKEGINHLVYLQKILVLKKGRIS